MTYNTFSIIRAVAGNLTYVVRNIPKSECIGLYQLDRPLGYFSGKRTIWFLNAPTMRLLQRLHSGLRWSLQPPPLSGVVDTLHIPRWFMLELLLRLLL